MKNLQKLLILSLVSSFFISFKAFAEVQNFTERDEKFLKITKSLKCLVCNGESVYDSNASFSIAMRKYIQSEIEQGKHEEQIINDIVHFYGEEILTDPCFSVKTALLWLLPFLLLIIGFYKLRSSIDHSAH